MKVRDLMEKEASGVLDSLKRNLTSDARKVLGFPMDVYDGINAGFRRTPFGVFPAVGAALGGVVGGAKKTDTNKKKLRNILTGAGIGGGAGYGVGVLNREARDADLLRRDYWDSHRDTHNWDQSGEGAYEFLEATRDEYADKGRRLRKERDLWDLAAKGGTIGTLLAAIKKLKKYRDADDSDKPEEMEKEASVVDDVVGNWGSTQLTNMVVPRVGLLKELTGEVEELVGDGTGPHGKGKGPGKGRGDGSGLPLSDKEVDSESEEEKNPMRKSLVKKEAGSGGEALGRLAQAVTGGLAGASSGAMLGQRMGGGAYNSKFLSTLIGLVLGGGVGAMAPGAIGSMRGIDAYDNATEEERTELARKATQDSILKNLFIPGRPTKNTTIRNLARNDALDKTLQSQLLNRGAIKDG